MGVRPRSLRLRLTLLYSGLFLASGAVLLAAAYGLVARDTLKQPVTATITGDPALLLQCKQAFTSPKLGGPSPDPALGKQCSAVFNAGSLVGAKNQRTSTLHGLLTSSLLALAGMAFVSGVLGWVVAGRALRPLQAITEAARRASHTNLGERLALGGPDDELKELADTFDQMLDRLDGAFASQRRFVANASHELRTPLTVMRTAIDVTLAKPERSAAQLEEMAVEVRTAIDRAESLIEALLTLARSDRGLSEREPVDLATAAEDALDAAGPAIPAAGLEVHAVLDPARSSGDPVLLERLAANLVDNAVRHNTASAPDGGAGPGWIRVTTGERGGEAFLEVSNTGAVVPEASVEELFQPFRRLDPAPGRRGLGSGMGPGLRPGLGPGLGLGLAIVASVAAAHNGSVTARPRGAGGLDVSVALPRLSSEQGGVNGGNSEKTL